MTPIGLAELAGAHLDLERAPFTLPSSRILVFRGNGGVRVHTAEYERQVAQCRVIDLLAVRDAADRPLPVTSVLPHAIRFGADVTLTFAGPHALSVGGPAGTRVEWTAPDGTAGRRTLDAAALRLEVGDDRSVRAVASERHDADLAATMTVWDDWFARCPRVRHGLQEMTAFCWWVLGANIVTLPSLGDARAVAPSKIGYVGLWQWDAYFIATGLRHGDPALAREQLELAFRFATRSGQLPDVVHDGGTLASSDDLPESDRQHLLRDGSAVADPDTPIPLTKPPLAAWALRKVLEVERADEWARAQLAIIRRSQDWWFATQDADGDGMPEYRHPYSSGLDDSPVFDHGAPTASPDLGAYLVLQDRELARFARELGGFGAHAHEARAQRTLKRLLAMWDGRAFRASVAGRATPDDAIVGLLPLLTGALPDGVARLLVDAMRDPARYGTPWGLPTVAASDPAFSAERMWRGPVWVNTNTLVAEGLARSGLAAEARALEERTVELVLHGGGPHEYFAPDTGQKPPGATTSFGWSAALFVDLAVRLSRERPAATA
ncbi:MAG: hypothetical protein QM611_08440 [Microbacterium sp.]|uniref:amylo-alpha-1,6-glucosidase n=1 Tax=Microbacterium sp. TaxID=51671 RepID=UPI0039E66430